MNARRFAKRRMYRITEKGLRAFEQVNALVEQAAAPAKVETFEHLESDEMEGFQVFCRFTANGLVYNRGSFLSVDEGLKLNSALQDSYLRRCRLPPDWKPTRRAVVAPVPAATFTPAPVQIELIGSPPMPHCEALAVLMWDVTKRRTWGEAKDIVNHEALMRATTEYANAPKILANGQRSGAGHFMRSTEGFWSFVATLCQQSKAEAA